MERRDPILSDAKVNEATVLTEGAVALITGGASGLGAGAARELAARGARVVLADLPGSRGAALADELGDAAAFVATDVTVEGQPAGAVEAAVARFGRLDVCLCAAGVAPGARVVARDGALFPLDLFRTVVDVNLIGLFDVVRHAAAAMARQEPGEDGERGLIVNVASITAYEGTVGQAAYAASKGGVAAMTIALARDLGSRGIRVMAIAPGVMDTPMLDGALRDRDAGVAAVMAQLPFPKRLGTPADVGRLVVAMMENPLLNGEVIRLDGGYRQPLR
jgi:3-hydroxyacyl-CoA dehydrogenase/3-hydroxy-2-methylbutyryl-CoA dehydrogenase